VLADDSFIGKVNNEQSKKGNLATLLHRPRRRTRGLRHQLLLQPADQFPAAIVALCRRKRNLRNAHYLVNLYVSPMLPGNISTPLAFARIDLRPCKAFAEIHYMSVKRWIPF